MTTAAIQVLNLSHAYNGGDTRYQVLDSANLSVSPGQCVALIGRSGSGKSTLLNLISGLEPISSGDVKLDGESMNTMNDHHRTLLRGKHIGFIYQAFNLIPTLSVHDNVALPLALQGAVSKQDRERIAQLLASVGLENRENDYPDRLSGGEQQRVAIARALVHKPALILADEPTGNLDANSGRQVLGLLKDLVAQQAAAMLLVTHSMEVAASADQIQVLDQGKVRQLEGETLAASAAW